MKNRSLFSMLLLFLVLLGCSKKYDLSGTMTPKSTVSIGKVQLQSGFLDFGSTQAPKSSSLAFHFIAGQRISAATTTTDSLSTWQHVFGGEGLIQYAPSSSGLGPVINDSVDLTQLAAYSRSLQNGVYSITLSTKPTQDLASTYIRFTASNLNLTINQSGPISFQGLTQDGLITIPINVVKPGIRPLYTVQVNGISLTYNFGSSNGFYFLYVGDQVNGTVSIIGLSGSVLSKTFPVSKLVQYNLTPDATSSVGGLSLTFSPFHYQSGSLFSNIVAPPKDSSLMAFYPFTGYQIVDGSFYNRHTWDNDDANPGQGPSLDRFGNLNAKVFDGTGNIVSTPSTAKNAYPSTISGFTISAWVYFSSYLSPLFTGPYFNHQRDVLILDSTSNSVGYRLSLDSEPVFQYAGSGQPNGNLFSLDTYGNSSQGSNPSRSLSISANLQFQNFPPPLATWTLLTYTQDIQGNWQWYLNGNLTNSGKTVPQPINFNKIYIGGISPGAAHNWVGSIDEVRVYSRPLSSSEVLYLSQN